MPKKESVLYHASPANELSEIQPKQTLSKDIYIGDFVFATRNKLLTIMYLAPRKAGAKIMHTNSKPPLLIINSTPEIFKKYDQGGTIYSVPSDTFYASPQKELASFEMVSKVAVKPIEKETYKTSLEALRIMDVLIYFVSEDVFKSLHFTSENRFTKIISNLKPFQY